MNYGALSVSRSQWLTSVSSTPVRNQKGKNKWSDSEGQRDFDGENKWPDSPGRRDFDGENKRPDSEGRRDFDGEK